MAPTKQKPKEQPEEPVEEVTLNDDGLPAGEPVDWATLQKTLAEKRNATSKEDDAV